MAANHPVKEQSGWQHWIHQPRRLWLYTTLFNTHYVVGMVASMYIGMMSLSGAVLVYRE